MDKKAITISQKLKLNKEQYELDFINIFLTKDLPLFIDPWAVRQGNDQISINSHNLISDFFEHLLYLIKTGDKYNAIKILDGLHEPSETNLGHSSTGKGLAIGKGHANDIYDKLLASRAVKTGLICDLEDTALMIDGIKEDKISDIVTNIIRGELIQYTKNQCKLHGIELRKNIPTGYYWDINSNDWLSSRDDMLVIEGKKILLIPKHFVTKKLSINYDEFYNFDVLEFEQMRHLDMASSLCRSIKGETKAPFKKAIEDKIKISKKAYIYSFSKENPEVLEEYKKKQSENYSPIGINELEPNLIPTDILKNKVTELNLITPGKKDAKKYENFMKGILELIFHPSLVNPIEQYRQDDGRKIIDLKFENSANKGFFNDLPKMLIPCKDIYVEFKNYTDDPKNPEFDQLNGRFSNTISQIGFLICREIKNKSKFIQRCNDYVNKKNHYIIGLDDKDIIKLIELRLKNQEKEIDQFFNNKIEDIL